MRVYFPEIYPDELVYSWFGRFAVHAGYINSQLLQFLYCKRSDTPIKEFIGNLNPEARECIAKIYPLKELVLEHTMYPQYARFVPLEQRKEALHKLCYENCDMHHLFAVLPRHEKEQYLKYCPICSREDRQQYSETYWHRKHQIRNIGICPKHKCKLMDSIVLARSMSLYSFITAEEVIPDSEEYISVDNSQQLGFAEYTEQAFNSPVDFVRDIPISAILYHGMKDTEYIKSTGNSRYMTKFVDDMTHFYEKIELNEIASISRIQKTLLTGRGYDFSLVCQLAFFLDMKTEELTDPKLSEEQIKHEKESHYIKNRDISDWSEYDNENVTRFEEFCNAVYNGHSSNNGRPERVSERMIYEFLNVTAYGFKNMPKCMKVYEKYAESYEQSWMRKIAWAYEKLKQEKGEQPIYWTDLRKLSGVKKKSLERVMCNLDECKEKDMVAKLLNGLEK